MYCDECERKLQEDELVYKIPVALVGEIVLCEDCIEKKKGYVYENEV